MFNLRKSTLLHRILTLHALFLAPALIAAPSKEVIAQVTVELQDIRRNLAQEALEYFEGLNYSFSGDQLCRTIVTESIPMTQLDILAGNIRDIVDAIKTSAHVSTYNTYPRKIERALRLQLYANRFANHAILYLNSFNESEIPKSERDWCVNEYSAIIAKNNARETQYQTLGLREDFNLGLNTPIIDMLHIADSFSVFIQCCLPKSSDQSHKSNSNAVAIDEEKQNNTKRVCMTIDDEDDATPPPSNTQLSALPIINPTFLYRIRSRKINFPNIGTQTISTETQAPMASTFLQCILSREQNIHDASGAQKRSDIIALAGIRKNIAEDAKKECLTIAQTMTDQIYREGILHRQLLPRPNNTFDVNSLPPVRLHRSLHSYLETQRPFLPPNTEHSMLFILNLACSISKKTSTIEANRVKKYDENIKRISEWQTHYQNILNIGIPYLKSLAWDNPECIMQLNQLIELMENDRSINVLPTLPRNDAQSTDIQKILDLQRITLANKTTRALVHLVKMQNMLNNKHKDNDSDSENDDNDDDDDDDDDNDDDGE